MTDCIIARTVGSEKYPIPCKELIILEIGDFDDNSIQLFVHDT